jgi:hypothetical protein
VGDVEVAVAGVEGSGAYAEVEQGMEAFDVAVAGELGEESSAACEEFGQEVWVLRGEVADGFAVGEGAGGYELIQTLKVRFEVALGEEAEGVGAASAGGYLGGGVAFASGEFRVGSVVEERFDHDEAVVAAQGLVEGGVAPDGHGVGVAAVLEDELQAGFVVPVGLAEEHGSDAGWVEFAAFEEEFSDGVVVAFGHVVGGLAVVGIGSAGEEEAGEIGVARDGSGSVDCALELGRAAWVIVGLVPAGVGAGSGVEEGLGGADEGFGARVIEAEVAREAEVGEGVPVVRAAGGSSAGGVAG